MGKKASQAGQECIPNSNETVLLLLLLRSEDIDPDERERFELCETFF